MTNYEPRLIIGAWTKGYALDLHTLSSQAIGYNEFGHLQFENKYSEVGGLLYQLKSKSNAESIPLIAAAAVGFLNQWKPNVDIIVPVVFYNIDDLPHFVGFGIVALGTYDSA